MNAYTSVSGGGFQPPSPTFDNKGNTLTQPRANGTTQTLTWDAHDRLRTATALATPSTTAQMFYDPLGRLTWVRRPDGANPPIDEIWSWSSWTLLSREVRQGSTPLDTFRYTWGPDLSGTLEGAGGVGGLLAVEHAPGTSTTWDIRHHHYDANRNVLALTNATCQVSARYRYSPFGELISSSDLDSSGWNTRNIRRFSTKPEVASTGLLYYGYRWYDAQTGRWPSRDPIEEEGGINLYGFVGNSPNNETDLLGLCIIYGKCVLVKSSANFLGGGSCEYDCYEDGRKPREQGVSSLLGIDVDCTEIPNPHTWSESGKPKKSCCADEYDSKTRVKQTNWGGCSRAACRKGCGYILSGMLVKGIVAAVAKQAYRQCVDTCNSSCKKP